MILLIGYIIIALIAFFVMVLYNETIGNSSDLQEEMFSFALFWPIVLSILVIVTLFWAVSSFAKWSIHKFKKII